MRKIVKGHRQECPSLTPKISPVTRANITVFIVRPGSVLVYAPIYVSKSLKAQPYMLPFLVGIRYEIVPTGICFRAKHC